MKTNDFRPWLALAAAFGLFATSSTALAQQTYKFHFQAPAGFKNTYKQQHEIEVSDVPGHRIRVVEMHADFSALGEAAPTFAGVRAKEAYSYLSSDYTAGNGTAYGYAVTHLQNGDRIFSRFSLMLHTQIGPDGKPISQFSQVGTLTGGTGKFKGIRGLLRTTGSTDFRTGSAPTIQEGSYYFVE